MRLRAFTPGTGIDILARVFAQKLQDRLKNPVVIENRPGASGNIGTEAVSKAPADGYTLLMTATTLVQSAVLNKAVPYDPQGLAIRLDREFFPAAFAEASGAIPARGISFAYLVIAGGPAGRANLSVREKFSVIVPRP